jgi:hypothetical protein
MFCPLLRGLSVHTQLDVLSRKDRNMNEYTDPKDCLAYQLDLAIQRGAISEEKALRFMDVAEQNSDEAASLATIALMTTVSDAA